LIAHRDGRRRLHNVGPYLSAVTAILLFLPHLSWLVQNNFLPLEYTEGRLERDANHYSAALTTALMVAGQLIALMFAAVLVLVLYGRRKAPPQKPAPSFDRVFLSFAAFGPFIAMFCMSLIFGYHVRDMWETPFWNFIGLWAVVFMRPALTRSDLRRFSMIWVLVFCTGILVFTANETIAPYVSIKPKRTIFPGKHLSHIVIDVWHNRYHTPLNYVIGDTWPAGNVAWYADDRPHVFMDGDRRFSPWIDMYDLHRSGGVIVWCMHCGDHSVNNALPGPLRAEFPTAEIQEPLVLQRMTFADVSPVTIGWAIVPPQ
jgi:hypothetical protein